MSRKHGLFAALAIAAIAQLAVPVSMIAKHERALRRGEVFKLKTAPVDPLDVFRGRYVALSFNETTAPEIPGVELEHDRKIFALLGTDTDGFARIARLSLEPPAEGAYLKLRAEFQHEGRVHLHFPFNRYYMPEDLAPRAETAYREHSGRQGARDAFVVLRVHQGLGVIEDLFIGDRSVRQFLEEADS